MKIVTLIENTSISKDYHHQHGLSLYIESGHRKILFDTGCDGKFIENANKLHIDLKAVDTVVISHGHYDHGGGLKAFTDLNDKAQIYMGFGAYEPHVASVLKIFKYNVGIKPIEILKNRIHYVSGEFDLGDGLWLFSGITGNLLSPKGNLRLLMKNDLKQFQPDTFEHEINLLLTEGNKTHLICGCAHKGIINIIDHASSITNNPLHTVIGGFHLMGISPRNAEDLRYLNKLTKALLEKNVTQYYTCHCTGEVNYKYMASQLNVLGRLQTGQVLSI